MPETLVIGGSGLVGMALVTACEKANLTAAATYLNHPVPGFHALDIRDGRAVSKLLGELKPKIVALPAANPYVDYCEQHPEETRAINVRGTRNVAEACKSAGAKLMFFSTDYVFDGLKGSDYREEDPANPLNEYGRQKLEGEQIVSAASAQNLIIRTSAVYGWQIDAKNFVLQVLTRLKRAEEVRVITDVTYKPTNADNLAEVSVALSEAGASGLFHVSGSEDLSRFDLARRIAEIFALDPSPIKPAKLSEFKQPAKRPKFSSFDIGKALRESGRELWDVTRGLTYMRQSEAAWRKRWTAEV